MDYRGTIWVHKTSFPMRADLPKREPEILRFWEEHDIPAKVRAARAGGPVFLLHDGPPYANGEVHLGSALNKILKDIVNKYWTMRGYDTPFVPGWDTHGLPIEMKALAALGVDRHRIDPLSLRRACREFAERYIGVMTEQFRRLGVRAAWDRPYVTLAGEYEAAEVRVFGRMYARGLIYKGLKSVHWCPQCETALAEAELEYEEHTSPSIYVAYDVVTAGGALAPGERVVIWTTTPWTLPASEGVAAHPDFWYARVATSRGTLLLAEERLRPVLEELGLAAGARVVGRVPGRELAGLQLRHPIFDRTVPLVLGEHVRADEGTGLVHTAPGHGEEDFEVGQRYGLPVTVPLDGRGVFTGEGGPFAGLRYDEANPAVIRYLEERGLLLHAGSIRHSYPYCWRCHGPTIFRATEQWFGSIARIRDELLAAVDRVRFVPASGAVRLRQMTADRADWCISRQRVWGLPIPVFYCEGCGAPHVTPESIEAVAQLFAREGSDAWWQREADAILPPGTRCVSCGGTRFRKETDILDVWFDSGCSHEAVLAHHPDLRWPADMYLEGSDQYRGWFNSSLTTAVAVRGDPPYRTVLCHGFVLDGEGRKMSKSLGNVVQPEEVIQEYGADILRLWVASSDFKSDVRVSREILAQVAEGYRKIRNTVRFLLANLADFAPAQALPLAEVDGLDRFVLGRLGALIRRVLQAYEDYDFHIVYHAVLQFCSVDLSAVYLDVRKDILYTAHPDGRERRQCQTVLYHLAHALTRLLAPILTFTSEEIWQHLPKEEGAPESVQLALMPDPHAYVADPELMADYERLLEVRDRVLVALEQARAARTIGSSLEAEVTVETPEDLEPLLARHHGELAALFIVSAVHLRPGARELRVLVDRAPGERCARCWVYSTKVGAAPDYPDLCPRCAEVLTALGVSGASA